MKEKMQRFFESLLDYGPIILTVGLAAYASIVSLREETSINEMLQWTLGILVLIASTQLLDRFRILKSSDQKLDQLLSSQQGVAGAYGFFQKEMPDLKERASVANTISISGTNLTSTSTKYSPVIRKRLEEGATVKIMFLNPKVDPSIVSVVANRIRKDLNFEQLLRSLNYALDNFSSLCKKGSDFQLRLSGAPLSYGIWIFDEKTPQAEIWVEIYTYQAMPEPTFHLLPHRDIEWYDLFYNQFYKLWEDASPWSPETEA